MIALRSFCALAQADRPRQVRAVARSSLTARNARYSTFSSGANHHVPSLPTAPKCWTLDKHIPIAVIVTICLQTVTAVWWAAKLESHVEVLEVYAKGHAEDGDWLIRIEERLQYMAEQIASSDKKLESHQ